jgi:hypothetical protein
VDIKSGDRLILFLVSGFSPAAGQKKTAGQIEKETNILLENGIGFHEVSYNVSEKGI